MHLFKNSARVSRPVMRLGKGALALLLGNSWFAAPQAIAGAPLSAQQYSKEKTVYQICLEANQLIDKHAYAQARDLLLPAAASDPTTYSAIVHSNLATAYRGMKDYQNAISETEAALRYNPHYEAAMYCQALTYYDKGNYDQSIASLRNLLQATTDSAWRARAENQIQQTSVYKYVKGASAAINAGKNTDALKLLTKAASFDPSAQSNTIHCNMAFVLRKTGKPEQAIVEGKKALQFDANDRVTLYTLGISYQDLGSFDEAISYLQRYLEVETDSNLRKKASLFIQELSDDRAKQDPKANSKPDYLEQLRSNDSLAIWPKSAIPLKIYMSDGKGVPGYKPIFRNFVTRALDDWCADSNKKLDYRIVTDPAEAHITVTWTRDELTMQENNRTRQKAGLTDWQFTTGHLLNRAPVRIRTVLAFDPSQYVSDGGCAIVTMHEIGHALGLGHSTNPGDVMYFGSSSKQPPTPSNRDKATIKLLYADYPQVGFVPKAAPIPKDVQLQFLPPPMFVPPPAHSTDKLAPPIFLPPPISARELKLEPPVFMPPSIDQLNKINQSRSSSGWGSEGAPDKTPAPPTFLPPAIKPAEVDKKHDAGKQPAPPVFMPPPK